MFEQRNPYKGTPLRPWVRLFLLADNGRRQEIDAFADTGNPCALIISERLFEEFNLGLAPGMDSNFGRLQGGWLRVQIANMSFDEDLLGYGNDEVIKAARGSHPDFEALAGLPLLRTMEYGGDRENFWIRRQ
jgi:hypothetical protein